MGAEVLHEPRLWPEYHDAYFGGFVRDTEGNNLEAVTHRGDRVRAPEEPAQGARRGGPRRDQPADDRIRLAKEPDGSVGLTFRDPEGRDRMRLGLDKHGHPSVELLGPNGGHAGGIS